MRHILLKARRAFLVKVCVVDPALLSERPEARGIEAQARTAARREFGFDRFAQSGIQPAPLIVVGLATLTNTIQRAMGGPTL